MIEASQAAELLFDRLLVLGMPPSAAKFYVHLLMAGPEKISRVAASVGISRDEAYRSFAHLTGLGFASATLTRPMLCVPAGPDAVLDILERRCRHQATAVRTARAELFALLQELKGSADASQGTPFRIINGRGRTYDALHDMLSDASTEILMVNSHPAAAQLAAQTGLWRRVQQRADIGLQIRILMTDAPGARRHIQQVSSPNCEVRLADLPEGTRFTIADQSRMIFFTSMDTSPWLSAADTAISTDAKDLVRMESRLFSSLWAEADPA